MSMDGMTTTTAPSTPAASPPSGSSPSPAPSAPAVSARPAPSQRGPDGKFQPGKRGETRRRILAGDIAKAEKHEPDAPAAAPMVELKAPAAVDLKAAPEKPAEAPQAPAEPAWKADAPETWPEPVRKAHEALSAELATHKETVSKWEDVGRRAVEQNRRLAEEIKLLRSALEQAGGQVDPRDVQLLDYRVKEQSAAQMAEAQKRRDEWAQAQAQAQEQAAIRAEAEQAVRQMQSIAKAKGVDIKALYVAYKAAQGLGEQITFEDAAQRVLDQLEWKQRAANKAAPSSTVASIPAGTSLPKSRTRQGRMDRLRALGHAL